MIELDGCGRALWPARVRYVLLLLIPSLLVGVAVGCVYRLFSFPSWVLFLSFPLGAFVQRWWTRSFDP